MIVADELSAESSKDVVYFVPEAKFEGLTAMRIENNLCFFIIYKLLAEYVPIYKSEIQKSGSNGSYKW